MFDRFSDCAKTAMGHAREESQRAKHDYIGAEHLLLGLLRDRECVASAILENLAVDFADLRDLVTSWMEDGDANVTMGQIPFTPQARRVLEAAYEQSSIFEHDHIGSSHLLLGLFVVEGSIASEALQAVGVTAESLSDQVAELLGGGPEGYPQYEANIVTIPPPGASVMLLGFDDPAFPLEWAEAVRGLLEGRGMQRASAANPQAGFTIAFAPERDPLVMFQVGVAVGRGTPVVALHLPGERIALAGVFSLEVDASVADRLAALFRFWS